MKKTVFTVLTVIFIIICLVIINVMNINAEKKEIKKENAEFEQYADKEIYGTDVATLISKAINKNEKNQIQKDEKGYYIENNENSIKIDLKMTTIDKTYPMEEIYNKQITEFVKNFNFIKFKCTKIEYHKKTNRISRIIFEELQ